MIKGWNTKYAKIVRSFGYSKKADRAAAVLLNSLLKKQFSSLKLEKMISGKAVFVIGAGPSLQYAIPHLKKHKNTIKICAETALGPLIKSGIMPDIIITDLDGNLKLLERAGKMCVIVVHAHGDNIDKLSFVRNFKDCVGTTQTEKIGKIRNFGGFTDGDRGVFLANQFGADKIFLFGMDFGPRIGKFSNTKRTERKVKLKKLQYGKMLLEWLAPQSSSDLFTLSKPMRGFKKITYAELKDSISV